MKVKELIEELKKLDQERNIWVRYDGIYFYEPEIDEEYNITDFDVENHGYDGQELKKGDYCI